MKDSGLVRIKLVICLFKENKKIDAIFASNDVDASLIIQVATEFKKQVPEDLLVVGYDGTETVRLFKPELTTIIQPIEEMAAMVVSTLMDRIEGKKTPHKIILPVTVHQGTTA